MLVEMAEVTKATAPQDATGAVRRIQLVTIAWMGAEAALALQAAWMARSPALLAFGGDSFVELFSAIVVLRRFGSGIDNERAERQAARIAGALLFALAAFVATSSLLTLMGHRQPEPTRLGIAVLFAAAIFMPWLSTVGIKILTRSG